MKTLPQSNQEIRLTSPLSLEAGKRVVGIGNIAEIDKWSNKGQFGFKIKLRTNKRKSARTKPAQIPTSIGLEDKTLERTWKLSLDRISPYFDGMPSTRRNH